MKRIFFYSLALTVCLSSCSFVKANCNESEFRISGSVVRGSGRITTEKYSVPDFDKVSVAISSDVKYIVTDGEPYVMISADDNIQEYLKFNVNGSELKIKFTEKNVRFRNCDIKIVVASSSLRGISISGAADFEVDSPVRTDNFDCSIAGSGDVEIDGLEASVANFVIAGSGDIDVSGINCKELKCSIAGSGDIDLSGYAENASYSIAGSGDINASDLRTGHTKTSISGSGTVHD